MYELLAELLSKAAVLRLKGHPSAETLPVVTEEWAKYLSGFEPNRVRAELENWIMAQETFPTPADIRKQLNRPVYYRGNPTPKDRQLENHSEASEGIARDNLAQMQEILK